MGVWAALLWHWDKKQEAQWTIEYISAKYHLVIYFFTFLFKVTCWNPVSFSPPEPSVRYGVLSGEWVAGEHGPRQERELDVHPEWKHAGETLLQRLGLLPTVSFSLRHSVSALSSESPSDVFFNIHLLLKPWLSPSDTITTHSTPLWVITQDRSRCWNWKSRPTPPSPPWRVTKVKYSFGYHACDRVQIIKYAALAVFSFSSHLFVNCKWEKKKKSTRKILVTWQKNEWMNKMGQICIQGLQSSCCHIAKKVNPPGKIGCHGYATPGNKQTNTALFFSSSLLEQGNRGVLWPHDHLRTSHACCMM